MGTEGENLVQADEKFFFNMHDFDEETIEGDALDAPPPPPVYNEQQLQAAKDAAHAKGREEALQESQASRAQFVAAMLEKIAAQTQALFAQEAMREVAYEREAVALSLSVFTKIFPVYHEKQGFNELQDQLLGVLKSQAGQKTMKIHVSPAYAEGMQSFMAKLVEKNPDLRLDVRGDEGIEEGAAHVSWDDGGAVRDANAMAQQIRDRIEEILAAPQATSHDDTVITDTPETAADIAGAPETKVEDPNND